MRADEASDTSIRTMTHSSRETLYRGLHVTVIAGDRRSDTVFVTFNPLIGITSGDTFWSESFLHKQRVDAIGIVSSEPDWFPADEMLSAVEAVKRHTAGRRVLTYGFSRGGYGALKFSRALGAERAIAFCPKFTKPTDAVDGDRSAFSRRRSSRTGRPLRMQPRVLRPGQRAGCAHRKPDRRGCRSSRCAHRKYLGAVLGA